MSKGPGHVQRTILAELKRIGSPIAVGELATAVFGPDPTLSQIKVIRRAVKGLARTRQARATYTRDDMNRVRLVCAPLDLRLAPLSRETLGPNWTRPRWVR